MKLSIAALTVLASVAYCNTIKTEIGQIPSCALKCLTTAVTESGCALGDYACQCGAKQQEIKSVVTPCVEEKCAMADVKKFQSIQANICTIQTGELPKQELKRVPVPDYPQGSYIPGYPGYGGGYATSTSTVTTTTTYPAGGAGYPATTTSSSATTATTPAVGGGSGGEEGEGGNGSEGGNGDSGNGQGGSESGDGEGGSEGSGNGEDGSEGSGNGEGGSEGAGNGEGGAGGSGTTSSSSSSSTSTSSTSTSAAAGSTPSTVLSSSGNRNFPAGAAAIGAGLLAMIL